MGVAEPLISFIFRGDGGLTELSDVGEQHYVANFAKLFYFIRVISILYVLIYSLLLFLFF